MDKAIYYIIAIVVEIILMCVCGFISRSLNESKGYYGGFAWGFWLGIIGILFIVSKPTVAYTPRESSIIVKEPNSLPPSAIRPATENSWKCTCGRNNSVNVTSCVCGTSKREALSPKPAAIVQMAPDSASDAFAGESKNINILREYKKLLDEGVITQEEFEAKKKAILSQ